MTKRNANVKHPCISCIYFKECGENTRTEQCKGRQTKTEQKKAKATANKQSLFLCKILERMR